MLQLKNIDIKLKKNGNFLFENLNYTLQRGVKCAVIGEEGDGKSTLLKFIYDPQSVSEYCEVSGQAIKDGASAYLPQFLDGKELNKTVMEYLDGVAVYENMRLLKNMKLSQDIVFSEQKLNTLSGGERIKLRLFKLLCKNPDILLLDEPSNDIDYSSLIWLKDFLKNCKLSVLFVSHDRLLLEDVSENVIHVEQLIKKTRSKVTVFQGGYSDYLSYSESNLNRQTQIALKQREEYDKRYKRWQQIYERVNHEQKSISRNDPHGGRLLKKKMKSVISQKERFEKDKENFIEIPDRENAIITFFPYDITVPNGKIVLDFKEDKLNAGEKILAENIELKVVGNAKIAIIGENGTGKTTLLKRIWQVLKKRNDIKCSYMPQEYSEAIDFNATPLEYLSPFGENISLIRQYLGNLNFKADEMISKTGNLSGGQQAKIIYLKMVLDKSSVLLLDEPTRNFSPTSAPVVCNALKNFGGAIISVSHDLKYVEEVCDKVYIFKDKRLTEL